MNNKIAWSITILNAMALLTVLILYFTQQKKVVYIDSVKLVNEYKGMQVARKEYQAKTSVWKANLDTLVKEVQREIAKYQKESPKMTAKEIELSKKYIQTKQQQLADYQKATNEQAGQVDAEATKKVFDEINAYIKEYGKTHHYTMILAANESGNIAYAEEYLDMTKDVLEGLNNKYEGKSAK